LSIYAGLKTAIGANVAGYSGKAFPLVAPEGTALPYATYQQIGTNRLQTLSGYTGGLFTDYQFNFYSNTYVAAVTAADAWVEYIKNFTGTLGDEFVQSVSVLNTFEDMDYVGSIARYRVIVECRFYYV
jgi:hypothetical protein